MVGASIIKEMLGYSDDNIVEGIPESLLHYAADHDFNQVFYYARNSDYTEKSLQLLADADTLSALMPISFPRTCRKEKPIIFYAVFKLTDDGRTILACPGGIEPISSSGPYKNGQMRVTFPSARCAGCPHREQCPANKGKRISAFVLSLSSINRAKTQWMMHGEDGADYARLRNGVETLPSSLRRNYHTDRLPRGRLRGACRLS